MNGDNLRLLSELLKQSKVWAVNLGENDALNEDDWMAFAEALPHTKVAFMFAEMECSKFAAVKKILREKLKDNRRQSNFYSHSLCNFLKIF